MSELFATFVVWLLGLVLLWLWPTHWCWGLLPWRKCECLGESHHTELYCPNAERREVMATEHTEPVDIDHDVQGGSIWVYECEHCGARHRFLWGPPAPIHVGDE